MRTRIQILGTLIAAALSAAAAVAAELGGGTTAQLRSPEVTMAVTAGPSGPAVLALGLGLGSGLWPRLGRKVERFAVSRHQCWRMRRPLQRRQ